MTIQSPLVYELCNLASSERHLHHCVLGLSYHHVVRSLSDHRAILGLSDHRAILPIHFHACCAYIGQHTQKQSEAPMNTYLRFAALARVINQIGP